MDEIVSLVRELEDYLKNEKEKEEYKLVIAEYLGEEKEVRTAKRDWTSKKHILHKHDQVMMHIYTPQKITFSIPDDYMWGLLYYEHSFLEEWRVLIS